jgi:hypothetical protein
MMHLKVLKKEITLEESLTPIGNYWPDPLRDIFLMINRSNITTFVSRIREITGYSEDESRDYFEDLINVGVVRREPSGYYSITPVEGDTQERSGDLSDNGFSDTSLDFDDQLT